MIVDGCEIYGTIENSVLFPGAIVAEGATVTNSVLFPNVVIESGVVLDRVIVGQNTTIQSGTHKGDSIIKVIAQNQTIK
jgi:glucose-1-phosphate adenylyltransferase